MQQGQQSKRRFLLLLALNPVVAQEATQSSIKWLKRIQTQLLIQTSGLTQQHLTLSQLTLLCSQGHHQLRSISTGTTLSTTTTRPRFQSTLCAHQLKLLQVKETGQQERDQPKMYRRMTITELRLPFSSEPTLQCMSCVQSYHMISLWSLDSNKT
jgi:hypothetical protein